VQPYYGSYWTGLNLYGWTEQPSRTIFVATTRIKQTLTVQGMTFKFVRLKPDRFFGFTERWVGSQKVSVADKEKTIVDCLDQPRYCGEIVEAAKGIWNGRNELNFEKLLSYADRMTNSAIVKRLGYIMETLSILSLDYRKSLTARIKRGYVDLDPGVTKSGGKNIPEWQIRVNINPVSLTEWITH
jgi:predicted transcriptional regulator of viral defense system